MQPVGGMPICLYQPPLWHLHTLCDLLGVGLHTLRTDGVQPEVWPASTEANTKICMNYDGQDYKMANRVFLQMLQCKHSD